MKIEDKYKWLARDKNGKLWAYENRPEKDKNNGHWSSVGFSNHVYIEEPTGVCSDISWEDKEPRLIYRISKEDYDLIENVDNINKPTHYHSGNIDVIKFSEENFSKEEQKGFHRINAIKYITRYDRKNGVEDLNKAKFYIDKLIEMEESE